MALPVWKASGTYTYGTGAITPPYPTGGSAPVAGDVALLAIESENQAISLSAAQGFVELGAQANKAAGSAGVDPASRMAVYWKRCVGSDTAPTVAAPGDHATAQIHLYSGCKASGDPWNVYAEGNDGAANDQTGVIPGATTTVADCLIVLLCSTSYNASSTTEFGSWTNGNLGSVTERADNCRTTGLGGGHGMATGTKAAAGAYGDTTVALAHTSYKGAMSIALQPPAGPIPKTLDASMSTFDGAQTRLTAHKKDASMSTFAGTVAKFTSCTRTASMATFAGSVAKSTQRTLSAVMANFAGILTSVKMYIKELAAGMATFAATLSRTSLKKLAGSMANFAGQTTKSTAHVLSASMSSFAGAFTKQARKATSASMSNFAGTLVHAATFGEVLTAGMAYFGGALGRAAFFGHAMIAAMSSFGATLATQLFHAAGAATSWLSVNLRSSLRRGE
jgi:hypothetical protein